MVGVVITVRSELKSFAPTGTLVVVVSIDEIRIICVFALHLKLFQKGLALEQTFARNSCPGVYDEKNVTVGRCCLIFLPIFSVIKEGDINITVVHAKEQCQ